MVSWHYSKKKWKQPYKSIKCLTKEKRKRDRQMHASMHAHSCMHACVRACTHTHTYIHIFNDRDWSWEDPKAQNLVSYCRPGLTAEKRTEGQECWTNSVLGWMSSCAYTEPLYWPISPQSWILWFHGGTLLLFLQRSGACTEMSYPSFLQLAGSTGNLNLPLEWQCVRHGTSDSVVR